MRKKKPIRFVAGYVGKEIGVWNRYSQSVDNWAGYVLRQDAIKAADDMNETSYRAPCWWAKPKGKFKAYKVSK